MLSYEALADLFKLFDDSPVKSNGDNLLVAPYEKNGDRLMKFSSKKTTTVISLFWQ